MVQVDLDLGRRLAAGRVLQTFGPRRRGAPRPRRGGGPLRVGYLSYDFREHPMGFLTRRLVSDHDGRRVQAIALSYGENDDSENRRRAETRSDAFVELFETSVPDAKEAMAAMHLDVVVDLMTHTRGARLELASESVVPEQALVVSYLGYPGPGGGVHFDYTMADAVVLPPDHAK